MRRPQWLMLAAGVLCICAQVFLDLRIPDYMSSITRLVQTSAGEPAEIWPFGARMLVCAICSAVMAVMAGMLFSRAAAGIGHQLRTGVFSRVQSFSLEEMDRFSTASLITRTTNDITQIQQFIARGMRMMFRAPIALVWALTKIATRHWQWTALTAGTAFVVVAMVMFTVLYAQPRFRRMQRMTDDLTSVTSDHMTGMRVIRACNAEGYQRDKFENVNERLTKNSMQANRVMAISHPVMNFASNALNIGIYCVGGFLIAASSTAGRLDIFSDMVVFSTYAAKIIQSFMSLGMILTTLPRASVSAGRVNEVLRTSPSIRDGEQKEGSSEEKGGVEFRNVSFKYPGAEEYALQDISFTARPGETVAIIGTTGSGKSTLVNLLPRFYEADMGEVLVNGVNVRQYEQKALRAKLGYVAQKPVLFSGTVRSNIVYGSQREDNMSSEQVKTAATIAQAAEFIEGMGGYDAEIQRGGANISGGQKQRLSIARAVFRRPEIYIFDDAFSALDYKTDMELRTALKKETGAATCIIVAQRIGTIRDADRIIVLDGGRIAGTGTHAELMAQCGVYQEIARTQLSEKELT